MKPRAIVFDCLGVLYLSVNGRLAKNEALIHFAQKLRVAYKVGLLTNLSAGSLAKYFTQAERLSYFDGVVVSGEAGTAKPSLGAYQQMANKLGVTVGECVLIDDSQTNCKGAVSAGMQAVLYRSAEQTINDVERLLQ